MTNHTGPHAAFYAFPIARKQTPFHIRTSHFLSRSLFAILFFPGGTGWNTMPLLPGFSFVAFIQIVINVTKMEARKVPIILLGRASEGS